MDDEPIGGSKFIEFLMTYGWVILIGLVAMGYLIFLGVTEPPKKIQQEVKYCLEWDGWITREDLWHNCIDFENLIAKCDYKIEENSTLSVYVPIDGDMAFYKNYNCTKYIIAMEVVK